jgi:hypothetical protein
LYLHQLWVDTLSAIQITDLSFLRPRVLANALWLMREIRRNSFWHGGMNNNCQQDAFLIQTFGLCGLFISGDVFL